MKYSAIILAAGSGKRSGFKRNKVLVKILSKTVLNYSIEFFENYDQCNQIILTVSEEDFEYCYQLYSSDIVSVIIGGKTRQKSVHNGLIHVTNDYVVIHDAARPIISTSFMDYFTTNYAQYPVLTVGFPVNDTIHAGKHGYLTGLLDRSLLYSVYTPQAFKSSLLLNIHSQAVSSNFEGTDDISLFLKFGSEVPKVFVLDEPNIKLTTQQDYKILEVLINENR